MNIELDVFTRSECAPRTARTLRSQHQLPAERNDPPAHAGPARYIFTLAYAHAFAKIAAGFQAVRQTRLDEKRTCKNKNEKLTHENESRAKTRGLITHCEMLRVIRLQVYGGYDERTEALIIGA